ncbi:MAG: tRNA (N(6)-L-threonylcarbamoyladenosine(37)-C(2))-methylthiotransferase [Nitrososphaerota archaeon]|nr:tRNA (N(6)-L-threonylcarbamoyladenosine(37)-C(2))-methylthiotransferase [Candidatus Bathyarchaeota archaeon]MDW8023670.1 tRNA (N(6)-L-threonylcarbamoyladenosine(37)-C(2))-methylthiotransferase [Nitrososphaerota archaeon]
MESVRVYIESFGCSTNLADGEVLAGCLARAGYSLVEDVARADLVLYNTCAVKGPTENRMIGILKKVSKDKKLVVAGCLPLINFQRLCKEVRFDGVVGPAAGEGIVGVVERVLRGEKVLALEGARNAKPSLTLPRVRLNPVVGIIPISYGCLGSCSYCCVILARGRLRSYAVGEIVDKVRRDLDTGVREFWLTSQDDACYGRDIGVSLPQLLEAVCSIEGDFKVRVGMMTPNMALNILEGLVKAYKNPKIFKFVHLPVQSGDDQILKNMRRFYSVAEFKRIIAAFRAEYPKITVATDVICGFPGETDESFERTLRLIEDVKPDVVNISKFFARPKTPAAEMADSVPFPKIKERSAVVARLAKEIALERNQSWVGWEGEILVDEVGKVKGSWVGRNFAYKPVVIKEEANLLGKFVHVQIIETSPTYLKGKLIRHQ